MITCMSCASKVGAVMTRDKMRRRMTPTTRSARGVVVRGAVVMGAVERGSPDSNASPCLGAVASPVPSP